MATFNITNKCSGVNLGNYDGKDSAEALNAMAVDAGYKSYDDMCNQFGDHSSDLVVTDVGQLTMYVFDNELLGDKGDNFAAALIDQHEGTEAECHAWFGDTYGANDYSSSFTAPDNG